MSEKKSDTAPADESAVSVPVAPKPNTITLDTPLKRGDQTLTAITLRKPSAGELRGLKLFDVLQLDVTALQTLLPRITSPALTSHDVGQLDLPDLLTLGAEVSGFFVTKADKGSSPA